MITHELKTWPEFFDAIAAGRKAFEVRRDDRGFQVGDVLRLVEYEPRDQTYTGLAVERVVTYKMDGGKFGVEPGHCVLGLGPITR